MPRISVFERVGDEDAFVAAWRARRAGPGGRLLRSHSELAEFRFAEVLDDDAPPPDLPATARSAVYEPVVDDLPDGASFEVVWINPYEVAPEEDEAFMAAWTTVRDTVKGRHGYIGSRLHRALDPAATFRFVNIAPWSDLDSFTAAVASPAFAETATAIYHQAHPSLFVVVAD